MTGPFLTLEQRLHRNTQRIEAIQLWLHHILVGPSQIDERKARAMTTELSRLLDQQIRLERWLVRGEEAARAVS